MNLSIALEQPGKKLALFGAAVAVAVIVLLLSMLALARWSGR